MLLKKTILFLVLSISIQFVSAQFPPETPLAVPEDFTPLENPAYLESVYDPAFDTTITRITDLETFREASGIPGLSAGSMQHQYAKIQAWNADMSLIHMGTVFFLNGDDYSINKTLFSASLIDARWSHIDPNIMYYGQGEDFKRVNVITEEAELLHTFPGYEYATIGPWEGNITANDEFVVITSYDNKKASIYDIVNDEIIATKEMEGVGFDWVSFTPSGSYIVMMNNETEHTEIYDMNFGYVRDLVDETQHADFAIDTNGDEVLVEVIELSMIRLSDGLITDLAPATEETAGTCGYGWYNPNIGGHVSGRSFAVPGWALVSVSRHTCENDFDGYNWNTEVYMIKLDGSGTIRPYGHTRSVNRSPMASISPDASKIIYTSNWNETLGDDAMDYVVHFNNTVGIHDAATSSFNIYPNPVKDKLHIEAEQIQIFDMLGKQHVLYSKLDINTIDVSTLPSGIYLVKGYNKETKDLVIGRFIKE